MPGGVTHHTRRLHSNWTAAGHRVEVIGDLGVECGSVIDRLSRQGVRGILIQYVPFLYGPRGISTFPERFARAAVGRGMRVTTFVHEPWVPPTRLPWIPLSWIQRRQLRRLIRASHNTVTTVPAWKDMLGANTQIVYVGCTLEIVHDPPDQVTPLPAPVVFSPFAAGLRWDWIVEATRSLATEPPLIVVGADADEVHSHHAVGRWFQDDWDCRGHLPATDVLALLARAKIVLSPFIDGMTGRRTSAFATSAAGARILTSKGHLFDPFFEEGALHVASTSEDFVHQAVSLWNEPDSPSARHRRIAWHRTHLDPASLDARLLEIVLE